MILKQHTIAAIILACAAGISSLAVSSSVLAAPVNINAADAVTLASSLKGVGLKKARAIVDYREANGKFKSSDDLSLVKGIGMKTVEINRKDIHVTSKSLKNRKK
ncbi:MAG: hypothetical protein BMS9Abin26_1986 [Gammaproteobacteria bacterium]|nr:MAG: hypothetical protein BMS9Abin26_1986 [Gammaproteobacteria bacterium]